jgi:hypothetical protein
MKPMLEHMARVFNLPFHKFLLAHGQDYHIGPNTYVGWHGEPGQCFKNATTLAMRDSSLTYVEGLVSVLGFPISHAWCARSNVVIDPTLRKEGARDNRRDTDYFGVPFLTQYVIKASIRNGCYGVFGEFSRKTMPKLFELGLEDGQQWLLNLHKNRRIKTSERTD